MAVTQVIISFALFFVCVPLVHFTNSAARMGRWRNIFIARWFGIGVTLLIGGLNAYLIISSIKVGCLVGSAGLRGGHLPTVCTCVEAELDRLVHYGDCPMGGNHGNSCVCRTTSSDRPAACEAAHGSLYTIPLWNADSVEPSFWNVFSPLLQAVLQQAVDKFVLAQLVQHN